MKKIILLAVCLFTISTAVNAQQTTTNPGTQKAGHERMTPEQRAQKNVDDMNAVATLSEDQKIKIKDLVTTKISKVDAIKAKYRGQTADKETMDKEIDAVKKEYRQGVQATLTPEQMEKVKAKNKETKGAKGNERADTND